MATVKMTFEEWGNKLAQEKKGSVAYNKIMGSSPNYAAAQLNVSLQMISKLAKSGKLERIELADTIKSKPTATLVTVDSINRYLRNRQNYAQARKKQIALEL